MNIKMPKKESKIEKYIERLKNILTGYRMKVTTRKGKIMRLVLAGIIVFVIIAALIVISVAIKKADTFDSPDNTKSKYLNAKNSDKVKLAYEKDGEKSKFLVMAKYIELKTANYYINNTSTVNGFDTAVVKLNKELAEKNWTTIDMEKPKEWIGSWSITDVGEIKFKFLNKQMEPEWINDEEVSKYIIKN